MKEKRMKVSSDSTSYLKSGPPFNGASFNPEVYINGNLIGNAWLAYYDNSNIRSQVLGEIGDIKTKTSIDTLFIFVNGGSDDLSWPNPTQKQLNNLATLINDINDYGMRAIPFVSHHCIIPNSAVSPSYSKKHVGGHKKGETVNGHRIWWDIPYCADNNIDLAKNWYKVVLNYLRNNVKNSNGIAYFAMGGNPHVPFATELSSLNNEYEYKGLIQKYLREVTPYVKSQCPYPLGVSTLPSFWKNGDDQLDYYYNFKNAISPSIFDFIDVTSQPGLNLKKIVQILGISASRVVPSDFKFELSSLSQKDNLEWHLKKFKEAGINSYWLLCYKDHSPFLGIRKSGYSGNEGGWKNDLLQLIKDQANGNFDPYGAKGSITASRNPCYLGNSQTCTSTISWSSQNTQNPCVFLKETGQMFMCGASGSTSANWISKYGYTFELKENNSKYSKTLASVKVYGI